MRIPSHLLKIASRFTIAGETEHTFWLEADVDIRFSLKKSVVYSNRLDTSGGYITLSETLYNHYVKPEIKKVDEKAGQELMKDFQLVVENRNTILRHPAYFSIRAPWLCSGGSFSGPINYCLGSVLEAWKNKKLKVTDKEGTSVYVAAVGGSNLSGMLHAKAWKPSTQSFVNLERTELREGLPVWLPRFAALSNKHPYKLPANYAAIRELLHRLHERNNRQK